MPLPCPAPAWISTLCPARVNSSAPTGIMATRYSSVLISLGTPITYFAAAVMASSVVEGRGQFGLILVRATALNQGECGPACVVSAPCSPACGGGRTPPAFPIQQLLACAGRRTGRWPRSLRRIDDALRSLRRRDHPAGPGAHPGPGQEPGRGPGNLDGQDQD